LFPLRDSLGNSGGFGPGDAYTNIVEVIGSAADTPQETKAKQEADAKAAADVKAKQEADAKAAAEAKAKQEADAKAAAEAKAKQEADAKAASTALIPPGNVSCSLTSNGVNFGVSLIFTSGNVVIGNLTYDWDYALLIEGRDPTLVANYSQRQFFKTTSTNALSLSYEELLTLAFKNPASTVLVFASPKNSLPEVSVKNTSGKGCYVELKNVLTFKLESEKAAADAKIASELKAKQEAEAKAAAELKSKQDAEVAAKVAAELKAQQDAEVAAEFAAKVAAELKAKLDAALKAALTKKTTITCIKGKVIKKVTAVKPVCPAGYRKK
jgi:hypothetical protein